MVQLDGLDLLDVHLARIFHTHEQSIQEYARPYKVVVGPATVAAIVDKFNTQRIGAVTLRGREKPIQVYEVLP